MSGGHRLVEVPPERLLRWVAGFGDRHGEPVLQPVPDDEHPGGAGAAGVRALRLRAPDGAVAELEVPWPPLPDGPGPPLARLAAHVAAPRTVLLVLVRRGGFAAAVARDGVLLDHATGTRYVQGRTAAGGQSQQRFARRRGNQSAALAGAAADLVVRLVARAPGAEVVVPGGDRPLVAAVLADPRLAGVAALPRGPLLHVADPRLDVLRAAAPRAIAVRVRLEQP